MRSYNLIVALLDISECSLHLRITFHNIVHISYSLPIITFLLHVPASLPPSPFSSTQSVAISTAFPQPPRPLVAGYGGRVQRLRRALHRIEYCPRLASKKMYVGWSEKCFFVACFQHDRARWGLKKEEKLVVVLLQFGETYCLKEKTDTTRNTIFFLQLPRSFR